MDWQSSAGVLPCLKSGFCSALHDILAAHCDILSKSSGVRIASRVLTMLTEAAPYHRAN
jgi:hypothetical protein